MPGLTRFHMRYISCSFAIKCLMVAMTPVLWMPSMDNAPPNAWRTGSAPNPSQSAILVSTLLLRRVVFQIRTSATSRLASERAYAWSQVHIHSFSAELLSYGDSTSVHEVFVPCSSDCDACWESSVVVAVSEAQRTILQAKLGNAYSQGTAGISYTAAHEDSCSSREIGLFSQCHVGHEQRGLSVALAPVRHPSTMRSLQTVSVTRTERMIQQHTWIIRCSNIAARHRIALLDSGSRGEAGKRQQEK